MSEGQSRGVHGDGRIVIIGGGVVGLSLAHHLARLGHTDVVVLERGQLGEGTTAYATGGIRQQFTSEINARLVHRSVELFSQFTEDTGAPFRFRQHGYMFLLRREEDLQAFTQAVRMQNSYGIESRVIDPSEVGSIMPVTRTDDLLGATYCPTDGSATPQEAVAGYAASASHNGVRIERGCTVTGIVRDAHGVVSGAQTTNGFVEASVVVIAAGPQARDVAGLAGVDLPVAPHRRQAFQARAGDWVTADLPLTVDLTSGAYLHPEGGGALVIGGNDRDVPEGTDLTVDTSLVESLVEALVHRFPAMEDVRVGRGWAGLREMTPDDHAIVGPVDETGTLWAMVGFSGHGFMQAPAIGEAVAQLLTTGASGIDLGVLRASRFAEGRLIGESVVF